MHDTTERKESEEKVRIFSQAIEQSAASIIITNLASEIEYVNPAFIKISGYQKSEIIGQNPRISKTEFNEKNGHKEMWECLERNESWRGVFYNKRKNGEHFWERVVISSPVFKTAVKKTNYVAVKDDITQKIQLENEKEKLIVELTVSLNDLKQFSFITSHNLRAPVTNLLGILDLLDASKIQDEETLELIEGFKKSTLKLNETLEDLIESIF
ncbi:MAG: PAS domain S-box protein, partial [Bacteroidia bacterium]